MRTHLDIKHTGNVGTAGRTAMTFDENSIAHLMSVLTDLYSDKELAVIREYSTNALDAHRAAGNPAPIEITLPSVMSPVFVVKDNGTGMTVSQITENFSKYGWSSKRDNDDEVGMLGLGCKSGLSYTSQFTMVTVHDGVRAVVLVTREEHGGGVVQIIDTSATTEPNGTEVTIPISRPGPFAEKARQFFSYWDAGTVMVNLELLETMWAKTPAGGILIDPDVILFPYRGNGYMPKHHVVMGGVPYPVSYEDFKLNLGTSGNRLNHDNSGFHVVARVPIGTVNFTPSREALQYTKRTKETLTDLADFVRRVLWDEMIDKINSAATHIEAWKVYQEWKPTLDAMKPWVSNAQRQRLTYRGSPFPDEGFTPTRPNTTDKDGNEVYRRPSAMQFNWKSSYATESTRAQHLNYSNLATAGLIVTGFSGDFVPAGTKERIRWYANEQGIDGQHVYLYHSRLGGSWMDHVPHVDYKIIREIKVPATHSRPRRTEAKYRAVVQDHAAKYQRELDAYPDEGFVAWISVSDTIHLTWVAELADSGRVALLTKRAEETFRRRHPEVPPFMEWLQKYTDNAFGSLSAMDAYLFYEKPYRGNSSGYHYRLIPYLIDQCESITRRKLGKLIPFADPTIRELLNLYAATERKTTVATIRTIKSVVGILPDGALTVPTMPSIEPVRDLLKYADETYRWLIHDDCSLDADEVNCRIEAMNALYIVRQSLHVVPIL